MESQLGVDDLEGECDPAIPAIYTGRNTTTQPKLRTLIYPGSSTPSGIKLQ